MVGSVSLLSSEEPVPPQSRDQCSPTNAIPQTIIVDLDGTLTLTDTLLESLLQLAKHSPARLLGVPFWLLKGRAAFKAAVAARTKIAADLLPYREPLVEYLRSERMGGRRVILATAAHRSIADAVSSHLGLFDDVIASDEVRNLKGASKLSACLESTADFTYAGDSSADIPIWKAARAAILVAADSSTAESVRHQVPIERQFPDTGAEVKDWLHALRLHHWVKNLLLFVPWLTSFSFLDARKSLIMFVAFLAFSSAASATYVVNDLLDLESDRAHPRKRHRPFASGKIPIPEGIFAASGALLLGLLLAAAVSPAFVLMLILYLTLTFAYSWWLKAHVLIDVLALSLLYTIRILAGSVAIGVATSSWLLAFSALAFLSLALIKRCSELNSLGQLGNAASRGRGYRVADLVVLRPLGVSAALSAVVVFGLFINAPETQARYGTPQLLWAVAIGLTYWLGRLWITTSRGEMLDDPVVYALRDRRSLVILLFMIAMIVMARFLVLGPLL